MSAIDELGEISSYRVKLSSHEALHHWCSENAG
jgi:hypothetical protein